MQIHELPEAAPEDGLYAAFDSGEHNYKIDYTQLADAILNRLTSKTFMLAKGQQTLIAAINALKAAAYYAVADDLTTTGAGQKVLDARQGRALSQSISALQANMNTQFQSIDSQLLNMSLQISSIMMLETISDWNTAYSADTKIRFLYAYNADNAPATSAHFVGIEISSTSIQRMQIVFRTNAASTNPIYVRHCTGAGVWMNWGQVTASGPSA